MPESQQEKEGIDLIYNGIISKPESIVLDIGAGEGKWGKLLRGKVKQIDGVEVWTPYIDKYKLVQYYDNLFNINMKKVDYSKTEYDIMILGDVLEHLKYDEAVSFINEAQKHLNEIYLIIPISECIQDGMYYGNPFESHLYQWTDKELIDLFNFKSIHVGFNPNGLVKIGTYIWKKNNN